MQLLYGGKEETLGTIITQMIMYNINVQVVLISSVSYSKYGIIPNTVRCRHQVVKMHGMSLPAGLEDIKKPPSAAEGI